MYYGLNTVILERHSVDPERKRKRTIPVAQISSVERRSEINLGSLLIGFLLFLGSNYVILQGHYKTFAFCFLFGIFLMTHCVSRFLTITMASGEEIIIEFTSKQKAEAQKVEERIYTMIADTYDEE